MFFEKRLVRSLRLFVILCFALCNSNCWAQEEVNSNPEVTHFDVVLFQNGEEVDCYNPAFPLEIRIFRLYDFSSISTPFVFVDYSSEGEHGLSSWPLPNVGENREHSIFFNEGHFKHKTPHFTGELVINVYVENLYTDVNPLSPQEGYLLDHTFSFPFCFTEFSGDDVVEERRTDLSIASKYYVFNTSGQLIKQYTGLETDLQNLSLNKGIYFVVSESAGNKKSVRRIAIF